MLKLRLTMALLITTLFAGCGGFLSPRDNLSPIVDQRLEDIEGNQATLENNQNAIKVELGRLQNALRINGQSNEVQQGWLNLQVDGLVIGVFSIVVISLLLFYMYSASKNKQIAKMIGEQIKNYQDEDLKEYIMAASWNTGLERDIFKLID